MTLLDERFLIELLEDLTGSQNDGRERDILLERCLNASEPDLDEFLDELSRSFVTYLPTLQNFISYLWNKCFRVTPSINSTRWNTSLDKFASVLITEVIMKNLHNSDISGFGELFHNCIELLWSGNNNKDNKLTTKHVFSAILDADGVLGVLISEIYGRRCLKRILFDFNIIIRIEQGELLKAVDIVATLLEKCSEHKEVSPQLSEGFSIYKACTALLETLRGHQSAKQILLVNRKNSLPPMLDDMVRLDDKESRAQNWNRNRASSNIHNNLTFLSIEDEQYLALLNMQRPQKPSDLPHLLRALEQRKIDSFRVLMEFLPCKSCHKQALNYFSPDKYFSEEESVQSDCLYRLPFEFNEDDKLGPWDILLSEDTIKDMRQLESSPEIIREVMKKLGQISSGEWDKHELRHTVQTYTIPVYEIELPNNDGLKILWQVDYGFSIRSNSLTQLVKVWAVTANKEQIHKILKNLSIVHQVYTSKHLCVVKQTDKGNIISPMIFEGEEGTKAPENGLFNSLMDDEKLLDVHKMLVTNKFVPLSKNLYKSLVLGGFNFTFQVSKKEYEIINNPTSAIIIGRSGTGKTTCIVFRQIASYLNRQLSNMPSNDRVIHKRQIFITMSPKLRHRVKEYFYKLRESAMLAGKKMSKKQFHEYRRKKEEEEEEGIEPMLEEGDEKDDTPNSFHELEDRHFPLFITYEKFSEMLQETYGIKNLVVQRKLDEDNIDSYDKEEGFYQRSSSIKTTNFVDYNAFLKRYWPRLSNNCNFDCELVYSEFSIIKGSNPEVDFLSREDYKAISTKKYPVFSYKRDQIYDLFQQYETAKKRNGHYDSIDRTLAILRLAKRKALGGPHIHEVYIDECQDNQIVDLSLILKVFDRANSIFLAGDIAQCIARGSSFRFQDLQALMYKWESTRAKTNHGNIINPKQFELNVNYRSHNGILQLSSSIIDLIWHFFPNSIDRLSREHSKVGGPQPIIFEGFQKEHFKIFSSGSKENELDDATCILNEQRRDENPFIEFGADQVIIVRDEDAKRDVINLIGKAGLVMTVFEAKGMEFNDVLLYNFFTDSPACRKWRVILSILNENPESVQTFSHEKHYILSSELKHLYVAVTRARQHIWICDENSEYSMPIKTYWKSLGLIKVTQSVDEIISTLAKKSNSDEWNQQGKNFFEQRQYEQAIFCFEKSGNKRNRELAHAYHLQQIAKDSINDSSDDDIKSNFICAAKAFIKCSRPNQAASCYQDISMYKEAGDVCAKWNMFEPAARCYNKANMWSEAGKYFEMAKNYTDAVVAYKNDNRYEKVIDLMRKYRQKIDKKIFHRITRLVNIHYRRTNNKEMSKIALSILPTQEEQIELLRDHAPEEFLEVCEKTGQFRAVAEDLRSHGEFEKAADKFNCSDNDEDMIEALRCLLYLCGINVLKMMTNITNTSTSQELMSLLSKAGGIISKIKLSSKRTVQWEKIMEEFLLYIAYLNKDLSRINKCIQFFKYHGEITHELRAIIMWLRIPQSDFQAEYWSNRLQYILRICDLCFSFIATQHQNINKVEKFFENFVSVSDVENCPQKRQIFFDNPLVHIIDEIRDINEITEITDNRYVYNVHIVHRAISKFLASYIYELIWDANQKGRNIPYLSSQICYRFASYQSCSKLNCKDHHVITTPSILYQRMKLACLQYTVMLKLIVLYHRRLLKEGQSREVRGLQRWWAESLIRIHIRYQSPRTSSPEITHMVLAKLPYHIRNGLIELAHKIWLSEFNNASNFEVMLKCMFVFQQLRDEWGVNKFYWEMSKAIISLYPNNLPIGYEYCDYYNGYHRAIPVGKRLSLFFFYLRSNHVIEAILNIKVFIQHAISNTQMTTTDALGDLVSLMEFATSLDFAVSPRTCDFFLSRAYLVNYFDIFNAMPLIPYYRRSYNREEYLAAVRNSFDQVQQLLELLIHSERFYLLIILRLIRLLVLIGLNESTFATSVLNLFRYLNNKVSSKKIKKYLEQKSMGLLVNTLHNDLKRTECDSLVIVFYQLEGITSKFSNWEKHGIIKLTYNSVEGFRSALQQIKSSVVAEENVASENHFPSQVTEGNDQNTGLTTDAFEQIERLEQLTISEEVQEPATEIQTWFHQIHDSPEAQEAAKKIQVWFRQVYKRVKSRQHDHDPILNEIYNDMMILCQAIMEEKGKKAVSKYNILLRGQTVDVIVELIRLQGRMEATKNRLKKTINNRSSDTKKVDRCLELEDELKYNHYEKVELALKSLSITENSSQHKKADIEWLENELYQAEDIINQVWEWINECKVVVK